MRPLGHRLDLGSRRWRRTPSGRRQAGGGGWWGRAQAVVGQAVAWAAVAGVVATAVTFAVILTQTSSSGHPTHLPSAPVAVRLRPAARPLPGATGGGAAPVCGLGAAPGDRAH